MNLRNLRNLCQKERDRRRLRRLTQILVQLVRPSESAESAKSVSKRKGKTQIAQIDADFGADDRDVRICENGQMTGEYRYKDLTEKIIGAAFRVHGTLGYGFLEKVYERALCVELARSGIPFESQRSIQVRYEGEIVGEYVADLIVGDAVIVEVKAVSKLDGVHEVQLVNYLKATGIEVGLLINFGPSVEVRRRILSKKE